MCLDTQILVTELRLVGLGDLTVDYGGPLAEGSEAIHQLPWTAQGGKAPALSWGEEAGRQQGRGVGEPEDRAEEEADGAVGGEQQLAEGDYAG